MIECLGVSQRSGKYHCNSFFSPSYNCSVPGCICLGFPRSLSHAEAYAVWRLDGLRYVLQHKVSVYKVWAGILLSGQAIWVLLKPHSKAKIVCFQTRKIQFVYVSGLTLFLERVWGILNCLCEEWFEIEDCQIWNFSIYSFPLQNPSVYCSW